MLTDTHLDELRQALRNCQIIVVALMVGALNFGVVAVLISTRRAGQADDLPILSYLAAAGAVVAVAMSFIAPAMLIDRQRTHILAAPDGARYQAAAQAFQTSLIVKAAILEGAIFFCLVSYLIEGQILSLVVAAVLFVVLAAHVPTMSRMMNWIEDQISVGQQLRQLR